MAAVLKRLLTLGLMLAFFVGTTVELVPVSIAHPDTGVSVGLADRCAGPQGPCTDQMPNCVDHICCIAVSALATPPLSIAIPFEWKSLDYDLAAVSLSGINVKPELSPPILPA